MADVQVYLLGTPRIEYQGSPVRIERRKGLALAAYLALSGQPQSRDIIASLLWPELDDEHARSALRSTLRALTTAVPVEWLHADRMTLALRAEQVWVDVSAFTTLLSQSSAHAHSPDSLCDECIGRYLQAAELYQLDFLTGFHLPDSPAYEDWQRAQREWLRRENTEVQRRLSHYYAETRRYDEAIRYARQWLAIDSLHEPAHRQLMRLYAATGQRTEALRQYQQCSEILDTELATPPESETTRLYEAIQREHTTRDTAAQTAAATSAYIMPPLPTLVIGREETLREVKRRIGIGSDDTRPVTVIQGWPGVGKSTTVALLAHDPEIARHFPDGILWASLGESPDIPGEINAWAAALNLHEPGRARKVEETSAQIAALLRDRRVLLLVDDIWQDDHAAPFRVGGQACALVMTTRLNDVASALAPTAADIYRLPLLTEAAGLELLGKLAPDTLARHPHEARELVRDLEGLPLALHVAGRLLHSEARLGWGVKELLDELREGAVLLQAYAPSDMLGTRHGTSPTIAALLRRSTDLLDEETRQRFAYLGLFVPKPATFDLEAMAVAGLGTNRPR